MKPRAIKIGFDKLILMKDYYQILDIPIDATSKMIKDQWLFLVQAWHPDKFKNLDQKRRAEQKTKEINEAYSILSDPIKRRDYDKKYKRRKINEYKNANHTQKDYHSYDYEIKGSDTIRGKYLEITLVKIEKNKTVNCDTNCVWLEDSEQCEFKYNVALNDIYKKCIKYTEVILKIKNIFDYELYISFENDCYLIDSNRDLYKHKFLFCHHIEKYYKKYLTSGEWLQSNTSGTFFLVFSELTNDVRISEITFQQHLFSKGYQLGWVRDTESYNIILVESNSGIYKISTT